MDAPLLAKTHRKTTQEFHRCFGRRFCFWWNQTTVWPVASIVFGLLWEVCIYPGSPWGRKMKRTGLQANLWQTTVSEWIDPEANEFNHSQLLYPTKVWPLPVLPTAFSTRYHLSLIVAREQILPRGHAQLPFLLFFSPQALTFRFVTLSFNWDHWTA